MYINCTKIIKTIEDFMKSEEGNSFSKDLKYHIATYSVCSFLQKKKIQRNDLVYRDELDISKSFLLNCTKKLDKILRDGIKDESTSYNSFLKNSKSTELLISSLDFGS